MPIQLEDNLFLKYVYNPDYLKSAPEYIPPYLSMIRSLKLTMSLRKMIPLMEHMIQTQERYSRNRQSSNALK